MKKVIVGIFAHPDDEAFLASGSFITWVKEGADLHLICATKGEKGENPDNATDLGNLRNTEWLNAGKQMGAKTQTQLNYPDGGLNNNLFHEIADQVLKTIHKIVSSYTDLIEFDLVTYENCGVTGHIDHIVMSFITTYIYPQIQQLLAEKDQPSRLLYVCACEAISPQYDTSFVFMPRGHDHDTIEFTVDASSVLQQKIRVMKTHRSQREDAEAIIKKLGNNLAYEHFNVFKD